MGLCASKPETVVSAAIAPEAAQAAKRAYSPAPSDAVKSSKPADSVVSVADEPVMLFDCRGFEVEREREGAVKALGLVDTPVDDPRFNAITKLMSSIFQTPVALITLITEDRVWFKSKVGPFGACVTREGSWCNYIAVPNAPEVLITEDASEDARFAANPYVAGAPFIKFYAGAPLVGRSGHRYGTLCVVDLKRRAFSAEMYALLINFANLVVQELERDAGSMAEVAEEAAALAEGQAAIQDMVQRSDSAVALVDVRSRAWPLLYANDAFAREEGGGDAAACSEGGRGLWDLFEVPKTGGASQESVQAALDEAVAAGSTARATLASRRTGRLVSLVLRPGSSDQLRPSKPIGIPNWVPSEKDVDAGCHAGALPGALDRDGGGTFEGPEAASESVPTPQLASCFWFVSVEGPAAPLGAASVASAGSAASSAPGAPATPMGSREGGGATAAAAVPVQPYASRAVPAELEGLEMGPLVGSGSFGRVYRGEWRGRVVAVKLIDCAFGANAAASSGAAEAALREAQLSKGLDHPCIVRTYDYAVQEAGGGGSTLWMVQQMCNHGTLIEAADRGWLRVKRSLTSPPDMGAVLRTLREIAAGMAFLHSKDVLHCDLTGNNVLLEAVEAREDARGFRARVGDFGLARAAKGAVTTSTFGTCSHMAPELMSDGVLTKAADVWSFGVIAWEVYSGVRAYVGLRMPHIVYLVTSGKGALQLPPGAPKGFRAMVESCLERDHAKRPTFEGLAATLDALLAEGEAATAAPPPPPAHSMGACQAGGELAAAAAALGSAPAVGTPNPAHS